MKINKMNDSSVANQAVTEHQLSLINKYTTRPFCADEIFVFSIVLCDNQVDRDFEQFTVESLAYLQKLFIGVTGIADHHAKSENQRARLFDTELVVDNSRLTLNLEPYTYLKGFAYMLNSDSNKDFIREIEAGIKKETSVSCATASSVCSICGSDRKKNPCSHQKGASYPVDGIEKLCFFKLLDPLDAYEWSFVAVPAQPYAGVTKEYNSFFKEVSMLSIRKKLSEQSGPLSAEEIDELEKYLQTLEAMADVGEKYLEKLRQDIVKHCRIAQPEMDIGIMQSVIKRMNLEELQGFLKAYSINSHIPMSPQLSSNVTNKSTNNEFKL